MILNTQPKQSAEEDVVEILLNEFDKYFVILQFPNGKVKDSQKQIKEDFEKLLLNITRPELIVIGLMPPQSFSSFVWGFCLSWEQKNIDKLSRN